MLRYSPGNIKVQFVTIKRSLSIYSYHYQFYSRYMSAVNHSTSDKTQFEQHCLSGDGKRFILEKRKSMQRTGQHEDEGGGLILKLAVHKHSAGPAGVWKTDRVMYGRNLDRT